MPTINIDYIEQNHFAKITPFDDCNAMQWSAVRRFFEERYPDLVENVDRGIGIPWWAFLSVRTSFRSMLAVNRINKLNVAEKVKKLLCVANKRAEEYRNVETLQPTFTEKSLGKKLLDVGFKRSLMSYQIANVLRLTYLNSGATFSVPGAGKTTEALAYYFATKEENDKLLVVAPKNAFLSWEDELPACVPSVRFDFKRLTGGYENILDILLSDPEAIIISYQQLPYVIDEVASFLIRNNVYLFVDESHRMKRGRAGVYGSAILSISHLPKRKLVLSGTPMPNASSDLVPQFSFLYPEILAKEDEIINKFKSVFVRTTKKQLGLKQPQRALHKVPLSAAQKKLYEALVSDVTRQLLGIRVGDRVLLRRIARCIQYLIQAASNPSLLVTSDLSGHPLLTDVLSEGLANKLKEVCLLTRKWVADGHKVLIWSTFVKTVEHLSGLLSDVGARFIHGGVPTTADDSIDSRETIIKAFNDVNSDCRVLVANPAACSEGISLHHVCHRALYVDRNYNAAQYLQSEDRIHRIGLAKEEPTYITILHSPDTIDESINRRLQFKVDQMRNVLNDPDLNITPLDFEAEDELFGIDEEDIRDVRHMLGIK